MSACLEIDRFENKLAQTADEFGKKEKLKKKQEMQKGIMASRLWKKPLRLKLGFCTDFFLYKLAQGHFSVCCLSHL